MQGSTALNAAQLQSLLPARPHIRSSPLLRYPGVPPVPAAARKIHRLRAAIQKCCQGAVAAVKADDCSPPGQQTGRTAALLAALPAACPPVLLLQAALSAACLPVLLLQAALKSTKCSGTIQAASSRRLFPSRLFRISCRSFHHSHDRADRFFHPSPFGKRAPADGFRGLTALYPVSEHRNDRQRDKAYQGYLQTASPDAGSGTQGCRPQFFSLL